MRKKKRRSSPATVPLGILTGALAVAVIAVAILRVPGMRAAQADGPETSGDPPAQTAATSGIDPSVRQPETNPVDQTGNVPEDTPSQPAESTPEPDPEYFTISMVGDCSLASNPDKKGWAIAYESVINGDFAYSFANTRQYFTDDYLTIANLEGNLSDKGYSSIEWFTFLSPAAYANILSQGDVDFVTLANNHTMDFGQAAYDDTTAALDAVGIPYGGENETYIYQTGDGLKVGLYCLYNGLTGNALDLVGEARQKEIAEESKAMIDAAQQSLRDQGAEYLVVCLHMGREGYYEPMAIQMEISRYAIDVGFDLVYDTHAHRLQPAEKYGNGFILYGLGNWIFGGNTNPGNGTDPASYDTCIAQVTVCRRGGSVSLESFNFIPCCISSGVDPANFVPTANSLNNYQPTPYEENSPAWDRAMSILNGTYEGANFTTDYGNILAAMNG